ncbi:hypothetical protein OOZ19_03170 [Saccharopolyspora sp. NFXS83]|uniref:hypothetical protein n=1 Tax=Saccharopolyspora sp. NFXS83 TaxID=2993560 RepID=UPI00224ADBAE|nr:hypothetical protein [Saccharopolyspora sp. NFXS83]MCX2729228.1 hypothetical protein [Saccharopolyspora sp. NFXS83]
MADRIAPADAGKQSSAAPGDADVRNTAVLVVSTAVPNLADGLMGRYSAVARLFSWGAMPVGAAVVGLLAEFFGVRIAFAVLAAVVLSTVVPFLRTATPEVLRDAERGSSRTRAVHRWRAGDAGCRRLRPPQPAAGNRDLTSISDSPKSARR